MSNTHITTLLNGHSIYWDEKIGDWRYEDDNTLSTSPERRCPKCKEFPVKGQDACIANLPGVKNACCGHGIEEGYIQFNNGIIVRGKFKIEKAKDIKKLYV